MARAMALENMDEGEDARPERRAYLVFEDQLTAIDREAAKLPNKPCKALHTLVATIRQDQLISMHVNREGEG